MATGDVGVAPVTSGPRAGLERRVAGGKSSLTAMEDLRQKVRELSRWAAEEMEAPRAAVPGEPALRRWDAHPGVRSPRGAAEGVGGPGWRSRGPRVIQAGPLAPAAAAQG